MARVLAEGTGAAWAQVWLVVGERPDAGRHLASRAPTASRPAPSRTPALTATDAGPGAAVAAGARTAASCSACSSCRSATSVPLTRSRSGCSPGSPPRPGWCCAARGCGPSSSQRRPSCRPAPRSCARSRQRLVDAQDAERRRLERDIHDGAQQHLVALAVNLRLAQTLAERSPRAGRGAAGRQERAAAEAIDDAGPALPRHLPAAARATTGWRPRCEAAVGTSPVPVEVDAADVGRLPRRASRRRRTSAASRPCRTRRSTPGRPRSGSTLRRDATGTLIVRRRGRRHRLRPGHVAGGLRPGQHARPHRVARRHR